MKPFRYIGKKRRTKEDPRFVTGRGCYVADIALPGMKHVALVTSPHASARIKAIRTEKAYFFECDGILVSTNKTCLRAILSYFFNEIFSVVVRLFFFV